MSEQTRMIPVRVGKHIEHHECEGDPLSARKILEPYEARTPQDVLHDRIANLVLRDDQLCPAAHSFVPTPQISASRLASQELAIERRANFGAIALQLA